MSRTLFLIGILCLVVSIHSAKLRSEALEATGGFTTKPTVSITDLPLKEGVEGGLSVTYSSVYNNKDCNTNFNLSTKGNEGWCASAKKTGEWVQIDAADEVYWRKVETKARHYQYVKSYTLKYSNDGTTWKDIPGTFAGNTELSQSKVNLIQPPVKARFLRIVVLTFHSWPSMKFDAYYSDTTKPTVSITDLPLKEGVEGGLSVTYSSVYNNKDCNTNFNLSTKGNEGWCASAKKTGEWVQIDAADEVYWRKVETKARHYQYVKSYTLKYSNDGTTWKDIPGTFAGNTELSQSKVNLIQPPVKARFLRIVVLTFHSWPSMKFDAYYSDTTKPTVSITDLPLKEGVEGGLSVTYSSVYNNKDCNTNFNLSTKGNEGWCASAKKTGEWVQIDAADEVYWRKVETKARHYQYVKSYTLKYSNDGTTWKDIPGTFAGNTELSQSKVNLIQPPVKARFLRIVVLTFHSWPSMKFDAYYSDTTKPTVSITDLPLKEGVEGGLSVTYSSVYNNKDCNTNFNLSTKGNEGWCASAKKTGEWVQIDAADEVYWRKVETKARHYQYVKSYTLKYSNDGTTWKDIPGTFAGNTELSQSKVNLIQPPVKARFLRIVVLTFHSWPSMKFDAYYSDTTKPTVSITDLPLKEGVEGGLSVTYSSVYNNKDCNTNFNLSTKGNEGWCASAKKTGEWVQIDAADEVYWRKVETKARHYQYVKSYTLKYSNDGTTWKDIPGTFAGNTELSQSKVNLIQPPVKARFLRIVVLTFHSWPSMKFDAYYSEYSYIYIYIYIIGCHNHHHLNKEFAILTT